MFGFVEWISSFAGAHPELRLDLLGRLLLATVFGGAVGWERQYAQKPAGLRTNVLICVGAALLADMSVSIAAASASPADPTRMAAQVVTGVGFLGAGAIIQQRGTVTGLTTAATIWVVAAIGLAAGFGAVVEAAGTTLLVLITLIALRRVEERTASLRPDRRVGDRRFNERRQDEPTEREVKPEGASPAEGA